MKENNHAEGIRNPDVAFEPRDVNPRALFFVGIGILVAGFVIHFGVLFTFDYFAAREQRRGLQPSTTVRSQQVKQPSEPQLQVKPERDLEELRKTQTDKLHGYDWVDQKAGTVRIPIERAIELLTQRGLPQVEQQQAATKGAQADNRDEQGRGQSPTTNSNSVRATGKKQP